MFFIILAIVLIIAAILVFLPINADVSYLLYKNENRFKVKIGLFSPVFTVYDSSKKQLSVKKEKPQGHEKESDKKKKPDFEYIKRILGLIADVFDFLKKKLVIDSLRLHFHIGTDDAACTGILTGSAWAFLYNFVSLCDNKFTLKKQNVNVCPDFEHEVFETDIQGIISIRVIHAVIICIKVLKGMKKI